MNDVPVLNDFVITQDMVNVKLDEIDINKSSGPDELNGRVLKEMSDVSALPILILFFSKTV